MTVDTSTQAPHPIALTAAGKDTPEIKAFRTAALDAIQSLRHAAACNFAPEYSGAVGEARCKTFYEAYEAVRTLPAPDLPAEGAGLREALGEPHCWVVPGRDTATDYGHVDAHCVEEGEMTRPLWPLEAIQSAFAALASPQPAVEGPVAAGVGEAYPEKIDWLRYGAITEMADAAFAVDGTAPSEAQMDRLHAAAEKMLDLRVSASLTLATLTPPADPKPTVPGNDAGMREIVGESAFVYILAHKTNLDGELWITEGMRQDWRHNPKYETSIREIAYLIADDAISLASQTGSAGEDPKTPDAGVMWVALEFYADPKNWRDTPPWDGDPEMITPLAIPVDHSQDGSPCDCGDIARKALASIGSQPAPVGEDETGVYRNALGHIRTCRARSAASGFPPGVEPDAAGYMQRYAENALDRGWRASLANQPPKAETPAGVGDAIRILTAANRTGDLPGCMMPDGAEPCSAFSELDQGIRDALAALSAAPAARPGDGVLEEIAAERRRQIEAEGWTPAHDDTHAGGEMSLAAAAYLRWGAGGRVRHGTPPADWPWSGKWWKPTTPRRDLVKAGALIVAEIERLDRAVPAAAPAADGGRA